MSHDKTSDSNDGITDRVVLPTNAKPRHYDLTFEPDFRTFKYEGTVAIELDIIEDSNSIALNIVDLVIHETIIEASGVVIASKPSLTHDEARQTTIVSFDQTIPAGQTAKLTQRFTGTLNDDLLGFYRSSYKSKSGETRYIAATQFECAYARQAFPCFDEPALKATFTVTLKTDAGFVCLGNMDVASREIIKERQVVIFNKTPLMSTYLVAFAVGDFACHEVECERKPVRVWVTPDQSPEHAVFSADLAARAIPFFEKTFGYQYPFPKLDLIALPDFASGAMENWGLIMARPDYVLLDKERCSVMDEKQVVLAILHELSHQWFGNLVTMEWWDELWLNEGFANWVSWYACNALYPDWMIWDHYPSDNMETAMSLDSLRSSHPIQLPIRHAGESDQTFDAICYEKSSCIIGMVIKLLGEDKFFAGLQDYLSRHAYGNTTAADLWAALRKDSGMSLEDMVDPWVNNVGFPVITVVEDEAKSTVHVKQERFLQTGDVKPEEEKVSYPVPLALQTKDGIQNDLVLGTREASFKVKDLNFLMINTGYSGFYRTLYSEERLRKLAKNAKDGLLTTGEMVGLIVDVGALVAAGYQETSSLLALLDCFDFETIKYTVRKQIIDQISKLRSAWTFEDSTRTRPLYEFYRSLMTGRKIRDNDGFAAQHAKIIMFDSALDSGDKSAKKASVDMFSNFTKGDQSALESNLCSIVFDHALYHGGEYEYTAVLNTYETAVDTNKKNMALQALGHATDSELIKRTLEYSLSDKVKQQDIWRALYGLCTHKEGILALWAWIKDKWNVLLERLHFKTHLLGPIVKIAIQSLTQSEQIEDVRNFFKEKNTEGYSRVLAQSLDKMEANRRWVERDGEDVETWLKNREKRKKECITGGKEERT